MKAKQLTINAMLAAMCAVLGYLSLDLGTMKITFEDLPVLLAGLMFGPVDGMLTGFVGTMIYQILRYGFSVTTALWVLPYVVCGLVAGLFAKKAAFMNTDRQIFGITALCEAALFLLNTVAIYVDSKVFGYYSYAYVFGAIAVRLLIAGIKTAVFGLLLPGILKKMSKITGNGRKAKS